jgi:hypothetical protein
MAMAILDNPSVGEDTIHIHHQQAGLAGAFEECRHQSHQPSFEKIVHVKDTNWSCLDIEDQ